MADETLQSLSFSAKTSGSLDAVLSSIGDGVIAADSNCRVTYLNRVAEQLTGWSLAEAQGKPLETIFQIVNEETRKQVENPAIRAIREGVIFGLANHTLLVTREGKEIPIDDSGAPIKDETGQLVGAVLVFREITERRKAERAQRGDLFKLTWERIDFQRGLIYVPNSKTGKDYSVPMNEDVRSTLQRIRRTTRGGGHVFINPDTAEPYTDIKTAFGTACQLAGIENLHWHDLRHTFGTRLAEAGCSEATIADLMGHSDPQTTRRYTHATDRAKRAAVEAVRLTSQRVCHNPATKQERPPSQVAVNG